MVKTQSPNVTSVVANVVGVLVIAIGPDGMPMLMYTGNAGSAPALETSKPQPVMAVEPDKKLEQQVTTPKRGRGRPKNATPAATIVEDDVSAPEHDPIMEDEAPTVTEPKARRGRKSSGGASAPKNAFQGKPMVPKMKSATGARLGLIRTKAGKEMEVWVLAETSKGYSVLNPDKKSECPKGYLFGCCWTVKAENFIKYL
jgi:hypothetical protein